MKYWKKRANNRPLFYFVTKVYFVTRRNNMRNLNTMDLFKIAKIIRQAGIKEKIKEIGFTNETTEAEIVVSLVFEAVTSISEAEKEILEFLADIAGVSVKELKEDEFDLLLQIIDHLKKQEKFINFLKQAFKYAN